MVASSRLRGTRGRLVGRIHSRNRTHPQSQSLWLLGMVHRRLHRHVNGLLAIRRRRSATHDSGGAQREARCAMQLGGG